MNHSPAFWDVVRSVLPDYEHARVGAARRPGAAALSGRPQLVRGVAQHAVAARPPAAARPADCSACTWATASPIAKVVWCRSSSRLNSTGSRSAALRGAVGAGLQHLGAALVVVRLQLVDALVQPGEGLAVRRQHQRVGRQRAHRARSTPGTAAAGSASGSMSYDADVGGDARQHHVAGDQHAAAPGSAARCAPAHGRSRRCSASRARRCAAACRPSAGGSCSGTCGTMLA